MFYTKVSSVKNNIKLQEFKGDLHSQKHLNWKDAQGAINDKSLKKAAAHKNLQKNCFKKLLQKLIGKYLQQSLFLSKVEGQNLPGDYFYMKHKLLYSLPVTYSINYSQPQVLLKIFRLDFDNLTSLENIVSTKI